MCKNIVTQHIIYWEKSDPTNPTARFYDWDSPVVWLLIQSLHTKNRQLMLQLLIQNLPLPAIV